MTANQNYALKAIHSILKQKKKQATTTNIETTIIKTITDLDATKKHNEALPFLELLVDPVDKNLKADLLKIAVKYMQMNKHKSTWLDILSKNFIQVSVDEFLFVCQTNIKELQFIVRNNFEALYEKVPIEHRHFLIGFICDNITFIEGYNIENILDYLYSKEHIVGDVKIQFSKFLWLFLSHITKREYTSNSFAKLLATLENMNCVEDGNAYLLKIVAKLLQLNHYHELKTNEKLITITKSILDVINGKVDKNNETIPIFRDFILYGYKYNESVITKFIATQIEAYNDSKSNFGYEMLSCFTNNFGLDLFYAMVVKNNFELDSYLEIFKNTTNVDLSIFIQLFGDLKNTEDAFCVFASFAKFCTDKNNSFSDIATILINEATKGNTKTIKFIAQGIKNIISTYLRYKENNIMLHNPISDSEIDRIFATIIEKGFMDVFYNAYVNNEDPLFQEAVQTILQIQGIDENTIETIQKIILSLKEDETADLAQVRYINNCKDITSVLRVARLFIPKFSESSAFTAKILSLLITKNNVLQKNAYSFLHDMVIYKKVGICICDTIIAEDYSEYYTCAIRYRLLTLFALYNNCTKCNKGNNAFLTKIIYELILNAKSNSAKARKISESILDANVNDSNYKEFIKNIVIGFNTDNYRIINGAIKCLLFFITNKKEYVNKNLELIVSQARKLQNKGKEVQRSVIELYKTMILEIDSIDGDEYLGYINKFANTRGKIDNAIKWAGKELRGKMRLTKTLDNIVHKKYKGQNNLNLTMSKKGVVELGYKTVFDSDSD